MTHLGHMGITQPPESPSKFACGVIGPRCWHDLIKIGSVKFKIKHLNNKTTREGEVTHCGHARVVQPLVNPLRHCWEAY